MVDATTTPSAAAASSRDGDARSGPASRFADVAGTIFSGVFSAAVVGLILAMVGIFSIWLLAPIAVLLTALLRRLWPGDGPSNRAGALAWTAAVVIAVASILSNALFPSEQAIGGRDGGTYLTTAAWLETDGSLLIDARVGPFAGAEGLEFGGPGYFDTRDDGRISPQFLHGFPVLAAAGGEVGGAQTMVRVNALLGGIALLALFAFAQLLIRPWLALAVEAAFAVNLVFVFFARAPFSEILTILFLFAGLWATWTAWERDSARTAGLGALLVGGTFIARLDALVFLIPVVAFLAYDQRRTGGRSKLVRAYWRGLLAMLLVGLGDLLFITPTYLANHRGQVIRIFMGVAAVVVVDVLVGSRIASVARRLTPGQRTRIAWGVGGVVLAGMLAAYFVRPYVQEVAGSPYLRLIMSDDELAAGESRLFSENSALWLGWYMGPVAVLIGAAGWAWLARRTLTGARALAIPFLLVFSAMTVLYLWKPSINPDQIWAMRRFLPITIPGFLVLAGFALDAVLDAAGRLGREVWIRAGVGVGAAAVFLGSLIPLAPVADLHEFDGLVGDVIDGCEVMGDDAAVLFLDGEGGTAGSRLAPSYRGFCGLPAAYTFDADDQLIESLRSDWAAQGRTLWLLSLSPSALEARAAGPVEELVVGDYDILELTFTRRPDKLDDFAIGIYGAPASAR